MTRASLALGVMLLACGPAGALTGKVTVEGGSAANLAVLIYGPASTATVTTADGTFTATSLPDGAYVVRVVLKGAEVEDQSVPGSIKNGKTEVAPNLTFKLPSGKVSGTVAFSDGSDASNLAVALTGTTTRGTLTGSGGAFTFDAVPTGAYVVEVASSDTREGRVGVGVAVSGASSDVGRLTLTPVGRVTGTVTLAGTPQPGVTVMVAGTELSAITGAAGTFSFSAVPAGNQVFLARTASPAPLVASVPVTVLRGANPDVTMALGADPRTGTVTGSVLFLGQQSPAIITVTVPGTTVNIAVSATGGYTLHVPVGSWDVVTTAPLFPTTVLGHVFVTEGGSQTLPTKTLSWFEPVWSGPEALTDLRWVLSAPPWFLAEILDSQGISRTLVGNRATHEARVVFTGRLDIAYASSTGKAFAFFVNDQLFTYETAAGALKAWASPVGPAQPVYDAVFSSDETTLFVTRSTPSTGPGQFLERVALSTGALTRFPSSGLAKQVVRHTVDRHLVWDASNEVTLVQVASQTPQLFTQVTQLFGLVPAALVGCTTTCTLKVVGPAGTTASTVAGAYPTSTLVSKFSNSTADYALVRALPSFSLVRTSDGSLYPLPTPLTGIIFNAPGTRYATVSTSGTISQLREDGLPPTTNPPVLAQSASTISLNYSSPTRLVAIDNATPSRIIDVKSGAATIDTDVSSTVLRSGPMVLWPSATTWKAIVGDEPVVALDGVPSSLAPTAAGARSNDPVPTIGYVSFDATSTWVINSPPGSARRSTAGRAIVPGRWGTTEVWQTQSATKTFVTAGATEQIIEVENILPALLDLGGANDRVIFALSGNQLLLAWPR